MSFNTITPFEVASRSLPKPVKCRFVHLYPAISLRHSDTIDCVFRVSGKRLVVAVSAAALTELRDRENKPLNDQQVAEIAALHLRRTLEGGYEVPETELFLNRTTLRELGRELGYI